MSFQKWIFRLCVFTLTVVAVIDSKAATSESDTIQLAETIVKGYAPERFLAGQKFRRIDTTTIQQFQFRSLAELLSNATPLAIKNYGPGQLATISFRGTAALHTAVLWNGLNINQPTLGQTDFSSIPIAGFDEIGLQYGSSSSVNGTDAVGGSILLNSHYDMTNGWKIQLGHYQASFNNYQTLAFAKFGNQLKNNWRISGKTMVVKGKMNNRYKEQSRNGYPMSSAETYRASLIQDLFLNNNSQEISAHVWLSDNDLTILPENIQSRERTHTKAYRTMLKYKLKSWENRVSWTRDFLNYGKGDYTTMSKARTDKVGFQTVNEWKGDIIHRAGYVIRAGGELTYLKTLTTGYGQNAISETRSDLYVMSRINWGSKWLFSANLRQAFVTRYNPPFTPSVGIEYLWLHKNQWTGKVKSSLARSYRVPTLNERYWEDIGNPDILPEHGWNKEAGMEVEKIFNDNARITGKLTGFHQYIQNWTFWNPLKGNRVENVQEVLARGLEAEIAFQNKWDHHLKTGHSLQYAFTRSTQEKLYDAYAQDVIGKQLPLTPVHTGNLNSWLQLRNYKLTAQLSMVGESYVTSEETQPIDGFYLLNVFAESVINLKSLSLRIQPQVYNLTNTFYLDVRRNAMPGRTYSLQLTATFLNKPR